MTGLMKSSNIGLSSEAWSPNLTHPPFLFGGEPSVGRVCLSYGGLPKQTNTLESALTDLALLCSSASLSCVRLARNSDVAVGDSKVSFR